MADTTTTNYGLTKPEVGASEDTWGTKINTNLDTLDTTVDSIQGKSGAGVLKHTNNTKLATTSTGIDITGNATFADNGKAIFGTGSDLQVYHDGSNSYIDEAGQGTLYVRADSATTIANPSNTLSARFRPSTSVSLYYNGVEKLATTSTGIDVTGTATMDGLTVDDGGVGTATDLIKIKSGWSSPSGLKAISFEDQSGNTIGQLGVSYSGGVGAFEIDSLYNSGNNSNKVFKASAGGDISFYEDTGTTPKLFWDASAESLGIGTSSPSQKLEVHGAVRFGNTVSDVADGGRPLIYASDGSGAHTGHALVIQARDGAGSEIDFVTGTTPTTRMRIDSSGRLLVGTTNPYPHLFTSGKGFAINQGTFGIDAACDNIVGIFNRTETDGAILEFKKDGSTVGSIGSTAGTHLYAGSGDVGLLFQGTVDAIEPWNPSTNGARANAIDLGLSGNRFRDLYLSGGVYLGGTGAANKLDDYEEGTWTPVTKSGSTVITTTVNYAKYVKIGALVYVTAFVSRADGASLTSDVGIHGLPFQVASGSAQVSGSIWFDTTATDEVATNYFVGGTSQLQAKKVGASGNYVTADQFQNSRPYYMSGVYSVAL